ncbi:hypothetical protein AZF37_03105 [endosymbiont 'TC1' of Trimyema compressum]|nr:hypothetical protein AZF37_03105 [endosymbiont 'TC1' of Trimyema compressum]
MIILSVGFRPNNILGKNDLIFLKIKLTQLIKNTLPLLQNAVRSGVFAACNVYVDYNLKVLAFNAQKICIYDLKMVATI